MTEVMLSCIIPGTVIGMFLIFYADKILSMWPVSTWK